MNLVLECLIKVFVMWYMFLKVGCLTSGKSNAEAAQHVEVQMATDRRMSQSLNVQEILLTKREMANPPHNFSKPGPQTSQCHLILTSSCWLLLAFVLA